MFLGYQNGLLAFAANTYDELKNNSMEFDKIEETTDIYTLINGKYQLTLTPLDNLKTKKKEEINQARDKAEQGGFEYMGKVFDSDQISCQRISTAAQALQFMNLNESGSIPVITWTCADNSKIDLTASDLAGLVIALMEHSNSCHQKATELKEQIDAAETKEELDNIRW